MKKQIKNFFNFSRAERVALIVWFLLMFIIAFVPCLIKYFNPTKQYEVVYPEKWKAEEEKENKKYNNYPKKEYKNYNSTNYSNNKKNYKKAPKTEVKPLTLQEFNPNTISLDELLAMNVPKRIAGNWTKFTSKNGRFYKPEDLKKVYGMTDDLFNQMKPFINIPKQEKTFEKEESTEKEYKPKFTPKPANVSININAATAEDYKKLRGIGDKLSVRIVKFREKLGGFYSPNQVGEVYGISDSIFQTFKTNLVVDKVDLQQIKINSIDEKTLGKHPYVSYKQAKTVINYRKEHGKFNSTEDLAKIYTLNSSLIEKLQPYLSFE